jgi:benzoate/toluate 1,2-dioxygenase reductase subunit
MVNKRVELGKNTMQGRKKPTPYNPPVVEPTEVIKRRWLSEGAFEVELSRPQHFQFKAGHTIQLIYQDEKRYYSLASAPGDPTLVLCVNFIEKGYFSPLLASAEIGFRLEFTGPHGYFTFSPSPRPPVFIATDTGIAPFVSMARSGIRDFTLLHGARLAEELYYQDLLQECTHKYLPIVWEIPDGEQVSSDLFHGKMVNLLAQHLKPGRYDFYLCGWQKMIKDVTHLIDDRFPGSHVYTEVFY